MSILWLVVAVVFVAIIFAGPSVYPPIKRERPMSEWHKKPDDK